MHELEIIKPLLKTKLDTIRNKIMHLANHPIPRLSEVSELSEFTWHFLKSTDLIASRKVIDLLFNDACEDDEKEWATVYFNTENWKIDIRGKALNYNVFKVSGDNLIEIEVDNIKPETETTYFSGVILGPAEILHELIIKYFAAL